MGSQICVLLGGVECLRAEWTESAAVLALSNGTELEARLVIAADGAESGMRVAGWNRRSRFTNTARGAWSPTSMSRSRIATWRTSGSARMACSRCCPCRQGQVSMVWSTADAHAQDLLAMTGEELARAVGNAAREHAWRDAYRAGPPPHLHCAACVPRV